MGHSVDADITPALAFYWFLEACKRDSVEPPSGTKHIKVDGALCGYLAEEVLAIDDQHLDLRVVRSAFLGKPVKQAFGVVTGTTLGIPEIVERDLMLRNYTKRQRERRGAA